MKIEFISEELRQNINNLGYSIIPLLNKEEVENFRKLYQEIASVEKSKDAKLFVSSRDCSFDESIILSDKIRDVIAPKLEEIASNIDIYGGAFIVKPQDFLNEFSLHQDFTLAEREKNQMLAIWIALQDTTEENGAFFLIEKSHLLPQNYISASYNNFKILRKEIDSEFIKTMNLKAGQAIIFNENMFHGSFSNKSTNPRIAITARISDKGAPFVYYQKIDVSTAGIYHIQPFDLIKYFKEFHSGIIPNHLPLIRTVPYIHSPLNGKKLNLELKKIYGKKIGIKDLLKNMLP